ncbi:hypothetical protein ABZ782_28240 [Streptomyces asoensis]
MGFINDAKALTATGEARKARERGQSVLVYKFIEATPTARPPRP